MMRTLLIGDMEKIEEMYYWFEISSEEFEIELIISENRLESEYYTCPIKALDAIEFVGNVYDIVFNFSQYHKEQIEKILLLKGINKEIILLEEQFEKFITKEEYMEFYSQKIYRDYQMAYVSDRVEVGEFTYGVPDILCFMREEVKVIIGKFCSIAKGALIMLGGEHNTDLCTTYPFNFMMKGFEYIEEHPKKRGDIVIGNDVWIGKGCKILSGVHVGNGAVIAAGAIVTKDVEPYTIVGGVPAKVIRKRFDDETIQKFEKIQWWNWEKSQIYDAIPLLQSNSVEELFKYYDTVVKKADDK